jgi:hypothetical protein
MVSGLSSNTIGTNRPDLFGSNPVDAEGVFLPADVYEHSKKAFVHISVP